MKYKLLIIAGALGVTGAAVAGAMYLARFPRSDTQLLFDFLVRTSRHDNDLRQ
jgi:hypothetical protein